MSKMINAVSFLAMLKGKCYYVSAFGENAELGIKYTDIEKLVNELPDTSEIFERKWSNNRIPLICLNSFSLVKKIKPSITSVGGFFIFAFFCNHSAHI